MPQQGSMPTELYEWAKKHCGKFGFRYPSQLLQQMINEARKLPRYANLPQTELSTLDETKRIGDRAKVMAGRAFSIANATSFKKQQLEGYKEALDDGTINREQYAKLVNELNVMVQANVDDELTKMEKQELLPNYSDCSKPKQLGRPPRFPHPELEREPTLEEIAEMNRRNKHPFGEKNKW